MLIFDHLPGNSLFVAPDNQAAPVRISSRFCAQQRKRSCKEKCGGQCCLGEKDCVNGCPNRVHLKSSQDSAMVS